MGPGAAVTASEGGARREEGIVVPLSGLSFHDGWFGQKKGWSGSQSYSPDSWAGLKAFELGFVNNASCDLDSLH